MKKQHSIFLILCIMCLFTASCANDTVSQYDTQESMTVNNGKDDSNIEDIVEEDAVVDVDLTVLSSTMVYAEVYNIMMEPDNYVGKTIKGSGIYNNFYYEEMDRAFHYFIISDATGCCPQGLDFVWNGDHIYPDDYPEIGEDIEVIGVFIKGEIEGRSYYYIAVDDISVLK